MDVVGFTIFPFFFVGIWIVASFALANISGWTTLAKLYLCTQKFRGSVYSFQYARFGVVRYSSVLKIGSNNDGLFVVPILMFRMFHKPLLIPWSEIIAKPHKIYWIEGYLLTFTRTTSVTMFVSKWTFNMMKPYVTIEEELREA